MHRVCVVSLLVHCVCLATAPGAPRIPSDLDIFPSAYLPGVTRNVELTCRPPVNGEGVSLLLLQLDWVDSGTSYPVVTMLGDQTPVVESHGSRFHATATGHYDTNPLSSYLRVDIPEPTADVAGSYLCIVETIDTHGLLHRYTDTGTLTSLGSGGVMPTYYRGVLQEIRADIDNMTTQLNSVASALGEIAATYDAATLAKLAELEAKERQIYAVRVEVDSAVRGMDQTVAAMRTDIDRLRHVTAEAKVSFYAQLSSASVSVGNNANIAFNSVQHKTDNAYSPSNGVFTCPYNGTYFFRAGVMDASTAIHASIMHNDVPVSSLFVYDDYSYTCSEATAVLRLVEGDQVKVVQTSGGTRTVYGYHSGVSASFQFMTYFMGMLLF